MVRRAEPKIGPKGIEEKPAGDDKPQKPDNGRPPLVVIVGLVICLVAMVGFSVCAHFDNAYHNWRGPFPLQGSVELTEGTNLYGAVDGPYSCYSEDGGGSLRLVRSEDSYVLAVYDTPSVTNDIFTRCPDDTRLVMTVRDWNRIIRHEQRLQDEMAEQAEAARAREVAVRRLMH